MQRTEPQEGRFGMFPVTFVQVFPASRVICTRPSLVPAQIPHVKRVIRSVDVPACERLARKVGSFDSERQVLNGLRDELEKVLPEMEDGWVAV